MNDRNQRNTASRKLPGIHPEYIIHTGVPPRRGVLLWVKGSPTPERTRPRRKRSVPREEPHDRPRRAASRCERGPPFTETTPNYFYNVSSPLRDVETYRVSCLGYIPGDMLKTERGTNGLTLVAIRAGRSFKE